MRIAAIADTHGIAFLRPKADVFIHGGDMTSWGEFKETISLTNSLGKERVDEENPAYDAVVLVPGNHDNAFEQYPMDKLVPFPAQRAFADRRSLGI